MEAQLVESLIGRGIITTVGNTGQIQLPEGTRKLEEKAKKAAEPNGDNGEKAAKAEKAAKDAIADLQTLEVDWVSEPSDQDKAELHNWLLLMTGLSADHTTHVWPDMKKAPEKTEHHNGKAAEQAFHEGHGAAVEQHQQEQHHSGLSGMFHKSEKRK